MVTTNTSQGVDVNSDSTATVSTMGQNSSCDTSLIHSSVNHDSTTTSSALISRPHTLLSSQPIMPGVVTEQNNEILVTLILNNLRQLRIQATKVFVNCTSYLFSIIQCKYDCIEISISVLDIEKYIRIVRWNEGFIRFE